MPRSNPRVGSVDSATRRYLDATPTPKFEPAADHREAVEDLPPVLQHPSAPSAAIERWRRQHRQGF